MNILSKIATLNKIFNFILQSDAVLDVMAKVLKEVIILVLIMRGRWSSHLKRPPKISFPFNFYKNVSSRGEKKSVVTIFTY